MIGVVKQRELFKDLNEYILSFSNMLETLSFGEISAIKFKAAYNHILRTYLKRTNSGGYQKIKEEFENLSNSMKKNILLLDDLGLDFDLAYQKLLKLNTIKNHEMISMTKEEYDFFKNIPNLIGNFYEQIIMDECISNTKQMCQDINRFFSLFGLEIDDLNDSFERKK